MDLNRLTQRSQEAVHEAQGTAVRFGHQQVDTEHLLFALLSQEEGLAPRLLEKSGVDTRALNADVQEALERLPKVSGPAAEPGKVFLTQRVGSVLQTAHDEAKRLKDEYVSVEHLMLALIAEGERSESGRLLAARGVSRERFLEALTAVRGSQRVQSAHPEATYEALSKYGIDLVEAAKQGKMDPVIGRDAEIRRTIRILSRKTKNNPVLIGEPGVGKTAIVEGLAQRIVRGRRTGGPQGQARFSRSIWAR